ncbi:hypothetical protein [Vitiosangium sp. GDMCC 1.1324]|uniref:hypothetical protein n=1 Tax=Vitiosangium sp. (strain GDMCC 1.1324) TaxID=2138576 RepID=UPI000D3A733C|nr:hypothetical protein [Vitiosangium sp. GDMCC 1.1324]PTL79078.1 hypothetical protein DAT35_36325 [Vitiosangium sp. GDMCC 1.1324]
MTCPLPLPEARRRQVALLLRTTPVDELPLLRARLYAATPAVGLAELRGREPKSRCAVCWVLRPVRLQWKEYGDAHRYTCDEQTCQKIWQRLARWEEAARAEAQARLVESVCQGVPA